jgi:hypothetical protein
MLASYLATVEILNIVLKCSRDVNLRSGDGNRTALVCVIEGGNVDAEVVAISGDDRS